MIKVLLLAVKPFPSMGSVLNFKLFLLINSKFASLHFRKGHLFGIVLKLVLFHMTITQQIIKRISTKTVAHPFHHPIRLSFLTPPAVELWPK